MMRLTGTRFFSAALNSTLLASFVLCTPAVAQQPGAGVGQPSAGSNRSIPRNQTDPRALQMQYAERARAQQAQLQQTHAGNVRQVGNLQPVAGQNQQANNPIAANAVNPNVRPFKELTPAENARLQKLLAAWEQQSKRTKTLTCKFQKWHFDLKDAPAGVHSRKGVGEIKYASPDQGLFRTDKLDFYTGMQGGKPQYAPQTGKVGDYWVCNGRDVIEFDANEKKCTITELPPGMQGQEIFNSPLPFVFNLDAQKIQQRYFVREIKAPKEGMYLIEAWPKFQADRSQYKLVQIALDDKKFLPKALIMYAPNFNAQTAPIWDHYEFTEVSQNGVRNNMKQFFDNFIPKAPPSTWKVVREKMPAAAPQSQAAGTAPTQQR